MTTKNGEETAGTVTKKTLDRGQLRTALLTALRIAGARGLTTAELTRIGIAVGSTPKSVSVALPRLRKVGLISRGADGFTVTGSDAAASIVKEHGPLEEPSVKTVGSKPVKTAPVKTKPVKTKPVKPVKTKPIPLHARLGSIDIPKARGVDQGDVLEALTAFDDSDAEGDMRSAVAIAKAQQLPERRRSRVFLLASRLT